MRRVSAVTSGAGSVGGVVVEGASVPGHRTATETLHRNPSHRLLNEAEAMPVEVVVMGQVRVQVPWQRPLPKTSQSDSPSSELGYSCRILGRSWSRLDNRMKMTRYLTRRIAGVLACVLTVGTSAANMQGADWTLAVGEVRPMPLYLRSSVDLDFVMFGANMSFIYNGAGRLGGGNSIWFSSGQTTIMITGEHTSSFDGDILCSMTVSGGGIGDGTITVTPITTTATTTTTTIPRAFVGRDYAFVGGHIDAAETSVKALGYEVLKDQSVTKSDAIAAAPGRSVWYTFSDGGLDVGGHLVAIIYDDPVVPGDLPAGLDYTLVFMNGCQTADSGSTVPTGFADKFSTDAYLGWDIGIIETTAQTFGEYFLEELNGSKTVSQARTAARDRFILYSVGWNLVNDHLVILRGDSVTVDLSP